jgi:hypothetical protein
MPELPGSPAAEISPADALFLLHRHQLLCFASKSAEFFIVGPVLVHPLTLGTTGGKSFTCR